MFFLIQLIIYKHYSEADGVNTYIYTHIYVCVYIYIYIYTLNRTVNWKKTWMQNNSYCTNIILFENLNYIHHISEVI